MRFPSRRALGSGAAAVVLLGGAAAIWFWNTSGAPVFVKTRERMRMKATSAKLANIREARASYYSNYSSYPTGSAEDVFEALRGRNPRGVKFIGMKFSPVGLPLDGWDREMVVSVGSAAMPPCIHSMGPDGIDQGGSPGSDDLMR